MVNAFVLAGGQSTRMGRDKALLEVEGEALVEHALDLLRGIGLEPRICGSRPDLARFAEIVPDNFPRCGPLAGIEAALAVSDSELNLFVPVDLPGLPADFLRWMTTRAEISQAVATVPRYGDRLQPLCAVYSRRLLGGLRSWLAAGRFRVMSAVQDSAKAIGESVDVFDVECIAPTGAEWPANPAPTGWFRNLNTPADYDALDSAGAKSRQAIS